MAKPDNVDADERAFRAGDGISAATPQTLHRFPSSFGSTKNLTRISSLLGTWTGITEIRGADFGMGVKGKVGDELGRRGGGMAAYVVVHFMPDPLRGYGCELARCSEVRNEVCVNSRAKGAGVGERCVGVGDNVVDWSDVMAFVYFGANVDVGAPLDVHTVRNTSSWAGPYSVVMAQNLTGISDGGGNDILIDRYVTRYVETPATSFLRPDAKSSLFSSDEWSKYVGPVAVKETVNAQYHSKTGREGDWNEDPYERYLGTCDNGDVRPLLPLFEFEFMRDAENGKETMEMKVKFKVLTAPQDKDNMQGVMPHFKERLSHWKEVGFRISGPFCYGGNPKRGWAFDLDFDSRNQKAHLTFHHGCDKDLPCIPPGAAITTDSPRIAIFSDLSSDKFAASSIWSVFSTVVILVLSTLLVMSTVANWWLIRKRSNLRYLYFDSMGEESADFLELEVDEQEANGSAFSALPEDNANGTEATRAQVMGDSSVDSNPEQPRFGWWRKVLSSATKTTVRSNANQEETTCSI